MIYFIDVPNETDVTTHAKVELILARVGPVTRTAIRMAEIPEGGSVPIRTPGYRYEVAVGPSTPVAQVALDIVDATGLEHLTIGFDANRTYNRGSAQSIRDAAAQVARSPLPQPN